MARWRDDDSVYVSDRGQIKKETCGRTPPILEDCTNPRYLLLLHSNRILSLPNILEEGNEATDDSQADHGSVDGQTGSSAVVLATATATASGAGARGVAAGVGVGQAVVALAVVDALDLAATALLGRRELLEGVASSANVVGAGDIESTLDVVQGREFNARRRG